ncbi:transposase [Streptomyces sp. NPDC026589]|uniref:IS701 family transposase n=1 Tax=Streptomyces sp. NPDC026589 TaxID=3155609 RepID=UPI0033D99386
MSASLQYSGALGGVGLCRLAVHLVYASAHGHAFIDRQLYLPGAWAEDEEHRLLRHVPDGITFATKPQQAAAMLHRARELSLAARWFTGDEVYGSLELRRTARTLGFDYALALKAEHRATTAVGRFAATQLAAKIPARAWMRLRAGNGTKGDRHDDWALIDVLPDDTPPGQDAATTEHAFLLVRRHRYTRELALYRCHSAAPVSLTTLVNITCTPAPAPPTEPATAWNSPRPVAANSWPSCGSPHFRNPDATRATSCTGPPGAAITSTRPPRPTAGGTSSPPRQPRDPSPWIKTYSCRD